jgi:MoxR-like ATPase
MADDDLRPKQVAKLTTSPPLPAELVDTVLGASDAERAAAAAELADRTREWLQSIGALKPSASVLDLDYRRLCALAGVFVTVERSWRFPPYQEHSLGAMLKIIPGEGARWVEQVLAWGGFLPPSDPAEPPEQGE